MKNKDPGTLNNQDSNDSKESKSFFFFRGLKFWLLEANPFLLGYKVYFFRGRLG